MNTLGSVPFHPFTLSRNYLRSVVDCVSLQTGAEYQAGIGRFCTALLFICCSKIQKNLLSFSAPSSGENENWKGWLYSTLRLGVGRRGISHR